MCTTCGCHTDQVSINGLMQESPSLHWTRKHPAAATASDAPIETSDQLKIRLEQDVLFQNQVFAHQNRTYFETLQIVTLNLVSSPGSGKTTLLEKTLTDLKHKVNCSVIEGDQQTSRDADRIRTTETPVVQINTGKGCHLDAQMVFRAVQQLEPVAKSFLFIENVGNLVCPALFDLGETKRVVITSVTEGDDKPLKYPDIFHSSHVCILNKTDLLPYVPFNCETFKANARKVNPELEFFELSALNGEGLNEWYNWLLQLKEKNEVIKELSKIGP
jgi:hydrogenase nickel incorporation protein HypB